MLNAAEWTVRPMASKRCDICECGVGDAWVETRVRGRGDIDDIDESGQLCSCCWLMLRRMQPSAGDEQLADQIDAVETQSDMAAVELSSD